MLGYSIEDNFRDWLQSRLDLNETELKRMFFDGYSVEGNMEPNCFLEEELALHPVIKQTRKPKKRRALEVCRPVMLPLSSLMPP